MTCDEIIINGGKTLSGKIKPQGAKNEALQVLSACLLTEDEVTISNVPAIGDVENHLKIMESLGAIVTKEDEGVYKISSKNVKTENMTDDDFLKTFSQLRGSLTISGAMLGRFGESYISEPGGDKIGVRPISVHTRAFKDVGATFNEKDRKLELKKIESQRITLKEASVTGTANIILTTVLAKEDSHKVEIYNAACEPYVVSLCNMLSSMGAKIRGAGTNLLTIESVNKLSGTTHQISPDMIEIGSFICLAAVCGDGLLIEEAKPDHLGDIAWYVFGKLGVNIEVKEEGLYIPKHEEILIQQPSSKPIRTVYDQIWPGLSPDHVSSLIAMTVHAKGIVTFKQKMFDRRLLFCDVLNTMGADIIMSHHQEVTVVGNNKKEKLVGTEMSSPDIRAGMALVIAALSAEGQSTIKNASQIHRGYENIIERLQSIGADISEASH